MSVLVPVPPPMAGLHITFTILCAALSAFFLYVEVSVSVGKENRLNLVEQLFF
jgi:hypothetical protein